MDALVILRYVDVVTCERLSDTIFSFCAGQLLIEGEISHL